MPTAKKPGAKKPKKYKFRPIRLPGRGNIDPKLIRKAVLEVKRWEADQKQKQEAAS